ncbi:Ion transport peptide-like [Amphibalanus amphitrite]|uniref:Crustacean hyperglycemic hormone form B n=1 Tax=Amphibalanus amphitrite TaxID=1232801 RepID=A0A482KLV6_AMPAM|nr:ion transport peptide-like isoform X2 [Amphibalanus amphitrite]XP_043246826.1 ion transport peptide-like isoform X2 [Amphibalanus amphitrite]KAF0292091.1 Ion transport peptide-like [Amphibalanus amphitrite]KAF0313985.1 Ion transport peptide-like [Amphibalanus amphitrite]QBQ04009.1 crustacean hyperglycemic hormone form B [Amphibalanus amphitrite]
MKVRMSPAVVRYLLGLLLIVVGINLALLPTGVAHPMLRDRRSSSYRDIECRGVFNKSVYARLNTICRDCFELYKEPELHGLCRSECFTTEYFKGCLQALVIEDQADKLDEQIRRLSGRK